MSDFEKRIWMSAVTALLVVLVAFGLTGCDPFGGSKTTVEVCIADCYEDNSSQDDNSDNSSQDNNQNQNATY